MISMQLRFLILTLLLSDCTLQVQANPIPTPLQTALERVKAGEGGPGEERVLRRYANDSREDVKLSARVGMSQSLRGRGQAREALAWVEQYATPAEENLTWPRIRGLVEAARVRVALGQTYDAVSRLNRARENSAEGLARTAVLRVLSELVETQPDLEKALEFEKNALRHGTRWFRRERRDETDATGWKPRKTGYETWEIWKPEIEARIADLERRIRIERYGLDFVLYEEAPAMRKADHPNALDFTDVASAFRLRDGEGRARAPGADFEEALAQYLEIATLGASEAERIWREGLKLPGVEE